MRIKSPIQGGDAFVSSLCKHMAEKAGFNGSLDDSDDILRQSPPSLLSAELIDRLKILSPQTWLGMIDLELKRGSASSFDISTVIKSAIGLLLPVLVLSLLRLSMLRKNRLSSTNLFSQKVLIAFFLSPWNLQCLYQLRSQLSMPLHFFRSMVSAPSSTLPRATDALKLRIQHSRAYRTRRYDVYLPSSFESPNIDDTENEQSALLFLPGASVAHEAYSEVAARLSDQGFVVAVMSLEPFRLASRYFGANTSSVKRIIQEVTADIHRLAFEGIPKSSDEGQQPDELPAEILRTRTMDWSLMGHSMGAFGAMELFQTFLNNSWTSTRVISQDNNSTGFSSTVKVGKKLVLWGVAAYVDYATDISKQNDAELLILQGTKDTLVDMKKTRQGELEAFFPPNTTTVVIRGGTHEGFASYEPSFKMDGFKMKRPSSLSQQHKRVCEETAKFLRSE